MRPVWVTGNGFLEVSTRLAPNSWDRGRTPSAPHGNGQSHCWQGDLYTRAPLGHLAQNGAAAEWTRLLVSFREWGTLQCLCPWGSYKDTRDEGWHPWVTVETLSPCRRQP